MERMKKQKIVRSNKIWADDVIRLDLLESYPMIGDTFYNMFVDPYRAHSNLAGMLKFFLSNPMVKPEDDMDLDYIWYAWQVSCKMREHGSTESEDTGDAKPDSPV